MLERVTRWRWDLILAAVILALGIAAYGTMRRYQHFGSPSGWVMDRWTGTMCYRDRGCWRRGKRISAGGDARPAMRDDPLADYTPDWRQRASVSPQNFDSLWDAVTEAEVRAYLREQR